METSESPVVTIDVIRLKILISRKVKSNKSLQQKLPTKVHQKRNANEEKKAPAFDQTGPNTRIIIIIILIKICKLN